MKKIVLLLFIAMLTGIGLYAQEAKRETNKQFMQINTVESVVAGGLGRSKMIVTNPDGSQKESDLENLFSLTGISILMMVGNWTM